MPYLVAAMSHNMPRFVPVEQPLSLDSHNITLVTEVTGVEPGAEGNTTAAPVSYPPCTWILYQTIDGTSVRIWDLIILIPNLIFLLFLLIGLRTTIAKLKRTSSPIFFAFYWLVFTVAVISVLRCVVSMTVSGTSSAGTIVDKVLWLVLKFFLLATELSVVVFGLAFGHLDSRTSIQRVLLITFTVALIYSVTQGVLEFLYRDQHFHIADNNGEYDMFGHGGMLFWFATSVFFCVIYTIICFLPCLKCTDRFALPSKKSFYVYCAFLALLNLSQAVGSGLLYYGIEAGMCMVDVTAYIYFTCYAPLVYITFLRDFFKSSQPPSILFSYKPQVDEEEDNVSLPNQSITAAKPEDVMSGDLYDSTQIDTSSPHSPNPLYEFEADLPPIGLNPELSINTDYYGDQLSSDHSPSSDVIVIT